MSEGDVALVDAGKPVKEVLEQLPLVNGSLEKKKSFGAQTGSPSTISKRNAPIITQTFVSSDKDLSILIPKGSITQSAPEQGAMLHCASANPAMEITLNRYETNALVKFENVVQNFEDGAEKLPGWRKTKQQNQSVHSLPAVYLEGTADPGYKYRLMVINGREHAYALMVKSLITNDSQIERFFGDMINSINVKG